MSLFRNLGERVERFKQAVTDAAEEEATHECRECGNRLYTERDQCPECGSDRITELAPADAPRSRDDTAESQNATADTREDTPDPRDETAGAQADAGDSPEADDPGVAPDNQDPDGPDGT